MLASLVLSNIWKLISLKICYPIRPFETKLDDLKKNIYIYISPYSNWLASSVVSPGTFSLVSYHVEAHWWVGSWD